MNTEAKRAIEAILMVADQPVEPNLLAQITEVPVARIDEICAELSAEYDAAERGFVIARIAGGYRFQSHPDLAPYVERFVLEGQSARMSNAALETLAIVAYKQPISRAQIASIRGVNADGVMRTLEARGYVHEIGRDSGPGNAVMYGTTPAFLEKLGLDSVDQLPPLGAFVPGADVVEQLERTLRVAPEDLDATDSEPGSDEAPSEAAEPAHDAIHGDAVNGYASNGDAVNGYASNGSAAAAHTVFDSEGTADARPGEPDEPQGPSEIVLSDPVIDLADSPSRDSSDVDAEEPQPGEP